MRLSYCIFSRKRIKRCWKTNTVNSGWRWKTLCCSMWCSMKDIKINTTSASIPVVFACIIKVRNKNSEKPQCHWSVSFHWSLLLLTSSGLVDGGLSMSDIKLPCRTHPHWLEPTIYQSETAPERSSTPSECIGLEARSMLSVAVKVSSQNADHNIKVPTDSHWQVQVQFTLTEMTF